jgi:hypothetical protein
LEAAEVLLELRLELASGGLGAGAMTGFMTRRGCVAQSIACSQGLWTRELV